MGEVQRLASSIVAGVLSGRSLDAELRSTDRAVASLSGAERAALHDIAYGTLRFLGEIDAIMQELCERPLKDERVRHLLRVALYQLAHTRAAPYAVVDHAVQTC